MGVTSNGNPYGVPENLVFSFPVTTNKGEWEIVKRLKVDEYSQKKIDITTKELIEERSAIDHLLK
jgi:malate/lactate dehydrogenase